MPNNINHGVEEEECEPSLDLCAGLDEVKEALWIRSTRMDVDADTDRGTPTKLFTFPPVSGLPHL